MVEMNPKSLPLIISSILFLALGTALIGVGIAVPAWLESSYPVQKLRGLFEICEGSMPCEDIEKKSGQLKLVIALCIGACVFGFMAVITTLGMMWMFYKKKLNGCMEILPWVTVSWSLIAGAAVIAGLVIYDAKENDSDDKYLHLGIAFVLTAAGGGSLVLGGLVFAMTSSRLLVYLKKAQTEEKQSLNTLGLKRAGGRTTRRY